MSSTILISSRITWDSFAMCSGLNSGFFTRSDRTSKALGRCSSRTLMEKLVYSLAVKASRWPPIESADRAISSAVRFLVPLKTMCSRKCEMPFSDSFSWREPDRSQTPIEMDRTTGMVSVMTVRPFGKTSFRMLVAASPFIIRGTPSVGPGARCVTHDITTKSLVKGRADGGGWPARLGVRAFLRASPCGSIR